uniref:Aldose 1-epimerase n=1 Tax=Aegilops tauschii subsp. strangulata TaxID=200361 RepID=A0A453CU72_AEGTS
MTYRFEFRLRVALGPKGDLFLTSRIRNTNTDGKPFSFTFAYHTYFSVSDIRCVYALQFLFLPFLSFFPPWIFQAQTSPRV